MLRRTLLVIFMAAVAVPVVASPCWACSCAPSANREEQRHSQAENSDLIFTGVAKSQRTVDPTPDDGWDGDAEVFTRFRVGKTYKGYPGRWVTISTASNGAMCGYYFEVGERYSVFADKQDGRFWTGLCSGTKRGHIDPDRYGLDD